LSLVYVLLSVLDLVRDCKLHMHLLLPRLHTVITTHTILTQLVPWAPQAQREHLVKKALLDHLALLAIQGALEHQDTMEELVLKVQ